MNSGTDHSFERCLAFVNSQLQAGRKGAFQEDRPKIAVTFSRQAGCGAHVIAEKVAEELQKRGAGNEGPWTVFDRNLVERVLEDHSLPQRLARFMPEDRVSEIADTLDELFDLHPPSWILVRNTAETILNLAELGNVILIGRAANVITSKMEHVFHVRLIAPVEARLANMQKYDHLGEKEAMDLIRSQDQGRKRYLRKYFEKDVDDPLLYHLVINTGLVTQEQAAGLICAGVLLRESREAVAEA